MKSSTFIERMSFHLNIFHDEQKISQFLNPATEREKQVINFWNLYSTRSKLLKLPKNFQRHIPAGINIYPRGTGPSPYLHPKQQQTIKTGQHSVWRNNIRKIDIQKTQTCCKVEINE